MVQDILVNSDPQKFFKPPYLGHKGWVGVRLQGRVDWEEVAGILRDGYLLSAPRKRRAAAPPEPKKAAVAKRKRGPKSSASRR